jgi:hypothetical protein
MYFMSQASDDPHNMAVIKNCPRNKQAIHVSRCVQEICAFNNRFLVKWLDS